MKRYHYIIGIVVAAVIAIGVAFLLPFFSFLKTLDSHSIDRAMFAKNQKESKGIEDLHFELVDPGEAPESIRQLAQLGYQIMLNTPEKIENYSGATMSCTNCHFAGGNTTGGKNNGISLVGVAAVYPKYNTAVNTVQTLAERINNCFERSLNSQPIALDSIEMKALLTYFQWTSRGIGIYSDVRWLGLPPLKSTHISNAENGQKVYTIYCAMCHGKEGEGELSNEVPPLWGPKSFNALAGMHVEKTLASFIYYNMPYDDPGLSEEQAIDVAAFIAQQPRPGKE
jgi:thiosulfate dehydrogenase